VLFKLSLNDLNQERLLEEQKYGTDLDRTDLSVLDWIQHIQDELHDGILYLEKLKQVLNGKVEEPNK
jgi:hypothetical protein